MAFPATNVTATKFPLLLASTRKRKYELFFSGAIQYFLLTPLSHDSLILQKSPSPHVFSKAARRIKKLFSSRLRRRNPVRLNVPSWRKMNSYGFLIQFFVPSIAVIWRERRTELGCSPAGKIIGTRRPPALAIQFLSPLAADSLRPGNSGKRRGEGGRKDQVDSSWAPRTVVAKAKYWTQRCCTVVKVTAKIHFWH